MITKKITFLSRFFLEEYHEGGETSPHELYEVLGFNLVTGMLAYSEQYRIEDGVIRQCGEEKRYENGCIVYHCHWDDTGKVGPERWYRIEPNGFNTYLYKEVVYNNHSVLISENYYK